MFIVFVARTTAGLVVQKDFEQLDQAKACYRQLFEQKPHEGAMVIPLEKQGYFRSFLLYANVIPSTVKPPTNPAGSAELEASTE